MIEVIRSGKRYEIDCECCGARLRFSKADEMHYGTSSFIICPECNKNVDTDCATEVTKKCISCTHSNELDGEHCYECVKGIKDNFEAVEVTDE